MWLTDKSKGILLTLVLSLALLFYFFGKPILNLNQTFFNTNGDGIHAYYTALYHVNHDTTFWRMNGMNYPDGEQVFFTGCQPILTNSIKAFSYIYDIKPYTVAILNAVMLLSIVLCALFLFLIFEKLKIPLWLAVLSALTLSFASPQIYRLNGHFSLTYQFAIPVFIYLLLCFREKKSLRISTFILLFVSLMTALQFYFFAFLLLISTVWWFFYLAFVTDEKRTFLKKIGFAIGHFGIQMVIPFVLIQFLIKSTDPVIDRTQSPWGFFNFKAIPESILYPFKMWYDSNWLRNLVKPDLNYEWEGVSYIGIIGVFAVFASFLLVLRSIIKIKEKHFLLPFSDPFMNSLFYASLFGFIIAIAIPFTVFDNYLYNHISYFKQLRGIGRFAWVSYYCMGIIGVYVLKMLLQKTAWLYPMTIILLLISASDAYFVSDLTAKAIHSQPAFWTEKTEHANYKWIKTIDRNAYQAIIPLPYFHIGSENSWVAPEGSIYEYAYMSSLYSGLPLTSVLLNRNSLQQTYEHLKIIQEASGDPVNFVSRISTKPFLTLLDKKAALNPHESEMIQSSQSKIIFENENMAVYELSVSYFTERESRLKNEIRQLSPEHFYTQDSIHYSSSGRHFLYTHPFMVDTLSESLKNRYIPIHQGLFPINEDSLELSFSARILNFYTDLVPRTVFVLSQGKDADRKEQYYAFNTHLISTQNKTGLIEFTFMYRKNEALEISAVNFDITDQTALVYHSLLLKPAADTVWFETDKHKWVNNRLFNN